MNFSWVDRSIIFLILIYAGCYGASDTTNHTADILADGNDVLDLRLPKTIVPISYEIMLMPQLEGDFLLDGSTHIKASVQEATDTIILNHGNITVDLLSVSYMSENSMSLDIAEKKLDQKTEKYIIKLKKPLKKGSNISIDFNYFGILRNDMIGFYKSSYIDSNGTVRWLAATQFQTKHARHAFPCFDEPSFKATFRVLILRSAEYSCLSNMPFKETTPKGGMYWDEFDESIPMSTYLVAAVVSDFSKLTTGNFSVWARPDAINQAKYALEIGPQALQYLSQLFQQEYQLPKMDMIAVPDFSAGAMENWGLVTYRETRMLYDENTASDMAKQTVASVIAHELSHMWFGNQVTPEWWSCLWLSEAFARYFQYFATAQIEKTWNMEKQFIVEQHQTALAVDGIESSEPMTRNVLTFSQLEGAGDLITYNKGASIVRMMRLVFGNDIFETVLRNYLKNNKEKKVAQPENLWIEFQTEVNRQNKKLGATVNEIMSTWTTKPGFPVLDVTIANGRATVRQSRFLLRNLKSTPTNSTWWIPITWASKSNPNFENVNVSRWISKQQDTFELGTEREWVVLNVQSAGFYRVNYDNASWNRIIEVLNSKDYRNISDVNRAAIVDDLMNLARAGLLEYKTTLDGLKYLEQETNYLPFKSAFASLTYLDRCFSGHQQYYEEFKEFVLSLIDNTYKTLGYVDRENDDRLTVLLRGELNKWACNYGHEGCIETFRKEFEKWRSTNNLTIKPNQRAVAYCTAIRHGTKDDWEFLWNKYIISNSGHEQTDIMQALGCTKDPALRERYMLNALKSFQESRIRRQDSNSVFTAVSGSGYDGAVSVLDFVQKYHKNMNEYNNGSGSIASVLSTASQGFATPEAVNKFENLIKTHRTEFKDIASTLNNSLEVAKYELRWFDKYKDDIISWIRENRKGNETDKKTTNVHRLPKGMAPLTYSIHVTPSMNSFTFTGEVDIVAVVKEKTNKIVLHSAVNVHPNVTVSVGGTAMGIKNRTTTEAYDFLTIELDKELTVGQTVNIYMSFDGTINDKGRGFYRSWYLTDSGERRWLAATQMEPVGARKMFPCFDEPALKAKFTMKVTVPKGYDAISNTQAYTVIKYLDGQKTITFKETPKMSTYLVVLVVSDFEGVTNYERYTVWARSNAINQTHYALSVMQPIVQFYENSLNIPYQLDKLDMTALPDFVSGAMENWGLLTYKERNLLYLEGESTLPTKQSITNVISHEIAHQWFGNMVSPDWWKYTWLNEGFARYFQYFGTEAVMKDWALENQFVVDQVHTAFSVDSSITSHPMTHDVDSPAEISGMFDNISYNKGGSVIRMIKAIVGDGVFYKSLEKYLKSRENDAATPEHLFEAFKQEITDVKLKNMIHDIMKSWTEQAGYPVVNIAIRTNSVSLKQQQYLTDGENFTKYWPVPITWAIPGKSDFENGTTINHWLTTASDTVKFPFNKTDLLIFNVRQLGFYRTNYEIDYWKTIIEYLKSVDFKNIHEINRAGIIDDLMNFGKSGHVDYKIVLYATQYLVQETRYAPLKAFFTGLSFLRRHFEGRDAHGAFKNYVTGIIGPIYKRMGFDEGKGDSHTRKLLRIQLRIWACDMGIGDCDDRATKLFLLEPRIEPNYRGVSYCAIARKNDNEYWKMLNDNYRKATVASEKALILQSLGCTTNPEFLNELLKTAISDDFIIRKEDSTGVFSNVIGASLEGVNTVMDFVKNNYNAMVVYYNGTSEIKSIVNSVGRRVTSEQLYSKYINLTTWLNEKDFSFNSTRNVADKERVWAAKYIPQLHAWMETNYPQTNYRLPKLFTPLTYNVSISKIEFEKNFSFTGKVQIKMQALQETSRIVLNSNELKIVKTKVYDSSGKNEISTLGQPILNKETETLTVFLEKFVKNELIILEIDYTGKLNEEMIGFYRSYYKDDANNIHWLATTQFQATHARNAFPCFDEPAYKARFTINIEKPKNYVALSNMPSVGLTPSDVADRVWESFAETVPMSTYLVAFVVSDFTSVKDLSTKVNVWSRPSMTSNCNYAQSTADKMLGYLTEKTGINYALPKLDLVSVPDFSSGAMENWGLATFREYALQYNDAVTSAKFKDYVTTIIAHELSHMWFGNLVTCAWWENTWLNEGFAEYMQWVISDMALPDHKYPDLFVVDELQKALLSDDYTSSHPMNKPVNSPSEISGIFDSITYGKGSSVLRMVKSALGENVFSMAINRYLTRHTFNATTPKDLWQAFDEVINETSALGDLGVPMAELMDSWTNEAGYPLVYATRNNETVSLTQERFSYKEFSDPKMVSYWIPITIHTGIGMNTSRISATKWMDMAPMLIRVDTSDWFIINYQQTGFYRVKYDRDSWRSLINAMSQKNHSNIHVTNRAQLVDDAFNLVRAQKMVYDEVLNLTNYLRNETEYLPWKAFFNGISFLLQRSEGRTDEVYSLIQSYILHLTLDMYKAVDFTDASNDDHLRRLNRELILTWTCKMEGEECVKQAKKLYVDLQTNTTAGKPVTISPNAKAAVYCTAMKSGSENDWNYLWELYLKEEFSSEKKTILEALGCTTNKEILQSYIEKAISGSFTSAIRKQDVSAVLTSIYNAGKVGVDVMLDYLINEYKQLHDYYGEWDSVGSLFSKLATRISTIEQLRKFEQFVNSDKKDLQEISSGLKKSYNTAKENFYWYEKNVYLVKYTLNSTVTKWNQERSGGITITSFSGLLLIIFSIVTFMLH